jgi:hypothetical protein
MSKLTIDAVQQRVPDVTLYLIEADRAHYALLAGPGLEQDRLHDLLLGSDEDGAWSKYFESTWFPLVHAECQLDSISALEKKVRTVRCEDIDKYIAVLMHHSDSINDNFADVLKPTLDEALADVNKFQAFLHE